MMEELDDVVDHFQGAFASVERLNSHVDKAFGAIDVGAGDYNGAVDGAQVRQQLLDDLALLREQLQSAHDQLQTTESTLADELAVVSEERDVLVRQTVALRQLAGLKANGEGDLDELVVRLQEQVALGEEERQQLQFELEELRLWRATDESGEEELRERVVASTLELAKVKESYLLLKADKRRLKAEKADLHKQMKELYATLEEKEQELKALVDGYEERISETESAMRRFSDESAASISSHGRDKWNVNLGRASLGTKSQDESMMAFLRDEELMRVRLQHQMHSAMLRRGSSSQGRDSPKSPLTNGRVHSMGSLSASLPPGSPLAGHPDQWNDQSHADFLSLPVASPDDLVGAKLEEEANKKRKKKQRKGLGSLSKVFMRPSRNKLDDEVSQTSSDRVSHDGPAPSPQMHGLTDEQLQERWKVLEEAKDQNISQWRAAVVAAWLEVKLAMPQYSKACQQNVKSGRVLLGMSDSEMEAAFGMGNPLHRRKLQLAIEFERAPDLCKCLKMRELDHIWISTVWMQQLGLSQHSETMLANIVDGSVLDSLSRKDMDKHLGITRKFHQASLLYGVELLRRLQFDRQVLLERRAMCEDADTDPLVWTNQRFVQWVHSIDLGEYAENLQESGVHGAIVVLESTFGGDVMATALGIPGSRTMIRRHLNDELQRLVTPARAALKICNNNSEKGRKMSSSVGRAFTRNKGGGEKNAPKRRRSFRDSLGKAFGRRAKEDLDVATTVESSNGGDAPHSVSVISGTIGMDLESTTV